MVDAGDHAKYTERRALAVEALAQRYHVVLRRYFARRGFLAEDASDLAQEVFVRLSGRDSLREIDNVEGYLFATAANVAVDFVRRIKVRAAHPAASFYESMQQTEELGADRHIEGRQELASVVAALNEMPERMRNVFILARLEDIPRAEIAQRLGISKSLVELLIRQATACLAERRHRL